MFEIENKLEGIIFLEELLADKLPEFKTLTPYEKEKVKRMLPDLYDKLNPIQTCGEEVEEDDELILKEELDMTEGYTREEFLDTFNDLDAQRLGLKFPENDKHISSDDRDELNEEFWFEVFIPHLELKLWDCLEAEETKYELGSIVSFWENVA